jgi:hypothetical protein
MILCSALLQSPNAYLGFGVTSLLGAHLSTSFSIPYINGMSIYVLAIQDCMAFRREHSDGWGGITLGHQFPAVGR